MLTVHHLGKSQSERIVWLCEELGIPYELKRYERLPVTMLAPPEYKALHPLGAAPVIIDGDVFSPSRPPSSSTSQPSTAKAALYWPLTIPTLPSSFTGSISPTARCSPPPAET
jgi:glutathione S-transferase